jgi:hypothetical protein
MALPQNVQDFFGVVRRRGEKLSLGLIIKDLQLVFAPEILDPQELPLLLGDNYLSHCQRMSYDEQVACTDGASAIGRLALSASIDTTSRDRDFWNPVHPGSARADYTRSEQHRFHAQRRASFTQTTV